VKDAMQWAGSERKGGEQAGALQGSLLQGMKEACTSGGWTSLYWGYTGFVIKAIPYDVGELCTYSFLSDTGLAQCFLPPAMTHLSIGNFCLIISVHIPRGTGVYCHSLDFDA
jgi:hypothetical protein